MFGRRCCFSTQIKKEIRAFHKYKNKNFTFVLIVAKKFSSYLKKKKQQGRNKKKRFQERLNGLPKKTYISVCGLQTKRVQVGNIPKTFLDLLEKMYLSFILHYGNTKK